MTREMLLVLEVLGSQSEGSLQGRPSLTPELKSPASLNITDPRLFTLSLITKTFSNYVYSK